MSSSLSTIAPDLTDNTYCVFGLAICFIRQESGVKPIQVVEPIPSATLEALTKGIATSYQWAQAMTLGPFLSEETPALPAAFPAEAHLCENFTERAIAAARTYNKVPQAKDIIPLGTRKADFNHSTERKRVLNAENIVSTEDNVKQHAYTHQVL
ncbi:MAG: hypothetical protein F6J87_21945 [Spirulina sp. SIO3F2]|nr:hypothetical protein [Spirulina sp. SIO3F2]